VKIGKLKLAPKVEKTFLFSIFYI